MLLFALALVVPALFDCLYLPEGFVEYLLVVPSIWQENAPLVIQEAFLAKTPVIASRIGGIPELVQDHRNGLLFEPGNPLDLYNKIRMIIDTPDYINKLKENIPAVKSIEEDSLELEKIYRSLTGWAA